MNATTCVSSSNIPDSFDLDSSCSFPATKAQVDKDIGVGIVLSAIHDLPSPL